MELVFLYIRAIREFNKVNLTIKNESLIDKIKILFFVKSCRKNRICI